MEIINGRKFAFGDEDDPVIVDGVEYPFYFEEPEAVDPNYREYTEEELYPTEELRRHRDEVRAKIKRLMKEGYFRKNNNQGRAE